MKKITKNNKGFSLIELIIVIAIMAVLVAIIAPNLTKYLGTSKKNTDKKNADEIASQIQTCITDYETENGYLIGSTGAFTASPAVIQFSASGTNIGNSGNAGKFKDMVETAISSSTQSKEDSSYAKVTIKAKDTSDYGKGYTIEVELGSASVKK